MLIKNETDPLSVFNDTVREVSAFFAQLSSEFHVSLSDYENFLKMDDLGLAKELSFLWDQVDIDIYDRFLAGSLDSKDYCDWKNALHRWKNLMKTAIQEYALKSFGQLLKTDASGQILEIAA